MGGERVRRGRGTPARTVAYAACGAVLLAGCASMPDSGDLRGVESTPRKDTQVRVYAMPPSDDATPAQIVQGFLEALTSDDADYKTARQYLTPEASKYWRPEQSTTVLSDGPGARADREPREDSTALTYTLTGTKFATVDAQQAYAPASGQYSELVRLVKDDKSGQWRIDAVPQGVVMGKSDFQRNYTSFNKYYFASNVDVNGSSLPMAVADPVYVRRHVDPTTRMVRSLISGPTSWLDPVVRSSFPTGTQLRKGAGPLTPDDRGTLTVPLNDRASEIGTGRCEEMAAQLLFTLRGLSPAVEEVELRADGGQLCSLTQDGAETVATRGALNQPDHLYFLDREHKLVRIAAGSAGADPEAAPGALGQGEQGLRSVAVARDERMAAGVGLNGQELFVSALAQGATLGEPVLRSQGKTEQDRLTPPSWDAQGGLWVADRDPARPGLYLLPQGADQPLQVRTPGLEGRIRAVRVAADGVRIALVVEKGDERSLLVGRIERSGPDEAGSSERTTVTVVELRSATPELE
ncbi:LpqB family beta-propeller domain-containing protein, partial [Streptomyces albogriseolus]